MHRRGKADLLQPQGPHAALGRFFSASEVDPLELKLQASTVFYGCTTITFHTVGAKADVAFGGHWEISTSAK